MAIDINPIENHREREKGVLVYPVYSRRSEGLSIGINLYPDIKQCSFDCPYCEVFPFSNNATFSIQQMKKDLRSAISSAQKENIPIKDICFSGNGEPTLSPDFPDALLLAETVRAEMAPSAQLVLITNGTGLLQPQIFSILKDLALRAERFDIWLKLDAGTPEWYKKINRSNIPLEKLTEKIHEFAASAPVTIQTMLCKINDTPPPPEEAEAWEALVCKLAVNGNIRKVQIYGKARPAPEDPLASKLDTDYLEQRAASLRRALAASAHTPMVDIYL
ncbi:MAG: hypothetical protein LBU88_02605 [Treponema sp.]|jgi:histidinol dehydrogenase|nr:hypothetical protein [Treponema sp.]